MDTATVQIMIMVGGFGITLLVFYFSREKEAENRGMLMQRVNELEKTIAEIKSRTRLTEANVASHDTDLSKVSLEIESLKSLIQKIDLKLDNYNNKLDEYFDRRETKRRDQRGET